MTSFEIDLQDDILKQKKADTQLSLVWRQFKRHKLALIGAIILPIFILIAIFGNWIMPYDPIEIHPEINVGMPLAPEKDHLLGTDNFGRDIVSRLISGGQISLSVGFVAVGFGMLLGVTLGSLAGFFGGWIDTLVTRTADVFLALPRLFLIMIANLYLGQTVFNVMLIIGMFSWMGVARLVRGEFLKLKSLEYISASYALGASPWKIILTHLLPNSFAPVIVAATIGIPYAILMESSLSFLGLGVPPPQASWGNMLFDAKNFLNVAPWFWIPPGLMISISVICFNFIGDGLRDAFDPTQHNR
ncbi:MAG: ABC transporter permease [Anaerolineaceae bacterium]|nr:ABC transporter permease [Anaerolineaceae bacterium]